ncbi:MAG: tetratricopeptide repeat protein, partial [Spirochaetaceae bacterium]|nr:tetratricopeptide repeat protein [Spirochaetaceae bacterium]
MAFILMLVPYVIQLLLIIHIMKNRRPYYWIWIVIWLPYIGGIAYFIVEILPEISRGGYMRKIGNSIASSINPMGEIHRLKEQAAVQDTVSNRLLLAEAYGKAGMYSEAIEFYRQCLTGPYTKDRSILMPLAAAYYHNGDIPEARTILDELEREKPFTVFEEQLLSLLVRESGGEDMFEQFEQLYSRSNSFEAGYYYVRALVRSGEQDRAAAVIGDMKKTLKMYANFKKTM